MTTKSLFVQKIDRIVRRSDAFSNRFFEDCASPEKQATADAVARTSVNWYLVTKHFALAAQQYDAVVAAELRDAKGERAKLLRELLIESAKISGDDLGIGHEELYAKNGGAGLLPSERTHYVLSGRIAEQILRASRRPIIAGNLEDLTLREAIARKIIEREFGNFAGGVAVYQVVETIAYNIVMAFEGLMKKLRQDNAVVLSDEDLLYLYIHKPLEQDHDKQSSNMVGLADQILGRGYRKAIETKVREIVELFSMFWERMGRITF